MGMIGMPARDIGIKAFNLMRQAHVLQEIQGAIDGWRLCRALAIKIGQLVIGFGRFVAGQ